MSTTGFICKYKGVACSYATMDGYCSRSACTYLDIQPNSIRISGGIAPDVLPDELIINGVKYRKIENAPYVISGINMERR